MNDHFPVGVSVLAAALLIGFFGYYFQLTYQLSFNGGPDEEPHYHAAKFIAKTGRLAVHPDDEVQLHFSRHGTTRSFRPPLSYLTGVAASKVLSSLGVKEKVQFRAGSAFIAALAVLFVFLAVRTFINSTWIALFAALCFGLLPQFTFLASYFNDDTGAIMVAALLLYALTLLTVRGVTLRRLTLVGVALGLVVISKPSAWVVSSILALCVPVLIVHSQIKFWRGLMVVAVMALLVGGWWVAFNVYHHGIHNPFNFEVERQLTEKYRNLPPGVGLRYADQGVRVLHLLANYDDFLVKTFKATVGNLDWLRLEMGPLQYGFYAALMFAALVGWLLRPTMLIKDSAYPVVATHWLLLFGVLLQIGSYLVVNVYREAQVQGRYLLPAFPVVVLMAGYALDRLSGKLRSALAEPTFGYRLARSSAVCAMLFVPVYVHLHGVVHYAVPFYRLDFYHGLSPQDFRGWQPDWGAVAKLNMTKVDGLRRDAVLVTSSGTDPWILLDQREAQHFANGVMLRITLESKTNGVFAVYWDEGRGMSESSSARRHYNIGYQTIYIKLPAHNPQFIRLDPLAQPGKLIIEQMAIAPLRSQPLTVPGFVAELLTAH